MSLVRWAAWAQAWRTASRLPRTRRAILAVIVLLVIVSHAWVGRELTRTVAQWRETEPAMAPVEVSVEGLLKPVEPVRKRRALPPPAVEPPQPEAAPGPGPAASEPTMAAGPPPETAPGAGPVAVATPAEPASAPEPPVIASTPPADPWPPSTRIRYALRGNFRGEFSGQAQVLWLRDGDRYRVELDIAIGPRAAPVASRRVVSEGRLGPNGLTPRRYEEDTRVLFSRGRRVTMTFEPAVGDQPGTTLMQDGKIRPAPAGTQDSASQFVQLAWLFGTQTTPVKAGDRVSFPLALSRRSDVWTYAVGEPETVDTPAGPVQTIHARPQREIDPLRRDLIAEIWFAPALQYLPVKMRVIVDTDTFALLVMDGLPELVGPSTRWPEPAR